MKRTDWELSHFVFVEKEIRDTAFHRGFESIAIFHESFRVVSEGECYMTQNLKNKKFVSLQNAEIFCKAFVVFRVARISQHTFLSLIIQNSLLEYEF